MVPIRQNLCQRSRYSIKCPYTRTPTRIVVHNTANDASAENEIAYMISNDKEVSFHYAVDDREIVQGLPLDRNAWASGDGHGKGNMEGIHVEICFSKSGGERFTQAERNAAEFIASLLKRYGWGIEKVTKHQDYDGKYCPHRTLDLGWRRFLNTVQNSMKEDDDMLSYEEFVKYQERYEKEKAAKAVSEWARPAVEYVTANGLMANVGTAEAPAIERPRADLTRQEAAQIAMNLHRALTDG